LSPEVGPQNVSYNPTTQHNPLWPCRIPCGFLMPFALGHGLKTTLMWKSKANFSWTMHLGERYTFYSFNWVYKTFEVRSTLDLTQTQMGDLQTYSMWQCPVSKLRMCYSKKP
jgi:hypothetical protein